MIRQAIATGALVVLGHAVGFGAASAAGCGPSFAEIEKAAAGGDVSAKLAKCRAEARAAFYAEQKTAAEAEAINEACKKREGL